MVDLILVKPSYLIFHTSCRTPIIQDVIFGDNWVQYGYMFYGHYDGTYSFELGGVIFDFPLAYFLTGRILE